MRALVTGGAGFIGSNLVDALVERGDTVAVIDDLSSGHADTLPPGVAFVRGLRVRLFDVPRVFFFSHYSSRRHLEGRLKRVGVRGASAREDFELAGLDYELHGRVVEAQLGGRQFEGQSAALARL